MCPELGVRYLMQTQNICLCKTIPVEADVATMVSPRMRRKDVFLPIQVAREGVIEEVVEQEHFIRRHWDAIRAPDHHGTRVYEPIRRAALRVGHHQRRPLMMSATLIQVPLLSRATFSLREYNLC